MATTGDVGGTQRDGEQAWRPEDDKLVIPRWLRLAGVGFAVVVVAAVAFAVFEPIQVLPRVRLAPGYALVSADGSTATSEAARGSVTLYSFAPTDCGERCDDMFETMAGVGQRIEAEIDLGETDFQLVTIALDDVADPAPLQAATTRSGADGVRWRWIGGEGDELRTVVGAGFRRYYEQADDGTVSFDPGFVLVDGNGVVRGEYRYQTLADDADKFVRHAEILAAEIRYAEGPAAVAYEAAHLFLCYP